MTPRRFELPLREAELMARVIESREATRVRDCRPECPACYVGSHGEECPCPC